MGNVKHHKKTFFGQNAAASVKCQVNTWNNENFLPIKKGAKRERHEEMMMNHDAPHQVKYKTHTQSVLVVSVSTEVCVLIESIFFLPE